jgi:hypothetical protein
MEIICQATTVIVFFPFLSLCFHTAALVTIKQSYYTYQLVTTLILYPRDSIQDYNKQGKITALVLVWIICQATTVIVYDPCFDMPRAV